MSCVFSMCCSMSCFQYVLFQTYLEANFTNIIFLTHIAFGDIVALKQDKMTRLKKHNDISIYLGQKCIYIYATRKPYRKHRFAPSIVRYKHHTKQTW